jgi:hypothetical protein
MRKEQRVLKRLIQSIAKECVKGEHRVHAVHRQIGRSDMERSLHDTGWQPHFQPVGQFNIHIFRARMIIRKVSISVIQFVIFFETCTQQKTAGSDLWAGRKNGEAPRRKLVGSCWNGRDRSRKLGIIEAGTGHSAFASRLSIAGCNHTALRSQEIGRSSKRGVGGRARAASGGASLTAANSVRMLGKRSRHGNEKDRERAEDEEEKKRSLRARESGRYGMTAATEHMATP